MHITEAQLKAIEQMGYRLFSPELIAINIEVDESDFIKKQSTRPIAAPEKPIIKD